MEKTVQKFLGPMIEDLLSNRQICHRKYRMALSQLGLRSFSRANCWIALLPYTLRVKRWHH